MPLKKTCRPSSFWQKTGLLLFGCFLALFLLEVFLQAASFGIYAWQRYQNFRSLKRTGAFRIMCIGESTTMNAYPRFLEQVLNSRVKGVNFTVIDKGLGGATSSVLLNQLPAELDEFRPDMVIAMIGINDGRGHPLKDIDQRPGRLGSLRTYRLFTMLKAHIAATTAKPGTPDLSPKPRPAFLALKGEAWSPKPAEDKKYLLMGNLYLKHGKVAAAKKAFKKAIAADPGDYASYLEMAEFYRRTGKFEEAEEALGSAVKLAPKNYLVYNGLGILYQTRQFYRKAIDAFSRAVVLKKDNWMGYNGMGWCYWHTGKLWEAVGEYKKSLAVNPRESGTYMQLGSVYQELGMLEEAEKSFKKALLIDPRESGIYYQMACFYRSLGKFSQARDLFEQGKKIFPDNYHFTKGLDVLNELTGRGAVSGEADIKYTEVTLDSYQRLQRELDKRNIRLAAMQYPMCSIQPLKRLLAGPGQERIVYIDNETVFKDAVKRYGFGRYFTDMFAGNFGHCTREGNQLLAANAAKAILEQVFGIRNSEAGQAFKRGLLVTATLQEPAVLSSTAEILRLVKFAKRSGVSDIFIQVYRANRAWFLSAVADSGPFMDCRRSAGRDPLDFLIAEAHKSGIKVHAWLNLLSLSSNENAPILKKHGPGVLTRNLKAKKKLQDYKIDNQYFLEPGDPRVRQVLALIVEELVSRYAGLDGVLFDYIRYPDVQPAYGFAPENVRRYREATGEKQIDGESASWKKWKISQVNELLALLVAKARAIRPKIRIAATGCLPFHRAILEAFQDWPFWIAKNTVDSVLLMDYSPDPREYASWIETAMTKVRDFSRIDIGVPAYKLLKDPQAFAEEYRYCRDSGCRECVIFHYGSLLDSAALASSLTGE